MKIKRLNKTFFIVIGAVLVIFLLGVNSFYMQDVGETIILRNFGGSLAGVSNEAGFHLKSPLQTTISWDTRNRQINFYNSADYAYNNGNYEGAEVSINDKSGTQANIDLQVIYSIDSNSVKNLYTEYGTQQAFITNYVSNAVRSAARVAGGKFDTMTLLTDRSQYADEITSTLEKAWADNGVIVEQVQVQNIKYDETITSAYADAQAAEVKKQKALNEQETAKVEAETKKIKAQGEADANKILSKSLTDEVIKQQYIEALKDIGSNGNLVVVPEGTSPIISTEKNKE